METNQLDELLLQVDGQNLINHVAEVAKNIRLSGSSQEKLTFQYIYEEFTKLGFNPQMLYTPAYISIPKDASLLINGQTIPCITHSMLPSIQNLVAQIEYLTPTELNNLNNTNLSGKIILTDGLAMADVLESAAQSNAKGVIFISGEKIHEMIVSNVWGNPTIDTMKYYPKLPAVSINYKNGAKLKEMLLSTTCIAEISTNVVTDWVDIPILTADLAAPNCNDYLLFTGHVDSWHYGAMDNASGNAATLEIARLLKPLQSQLERGIKFVLWSGHSHGRYAGSTAFCDMFFENLYEHCFLHINADCLGGENASLLTQAACMAETKTLGDFAVKKVTKKMLEGVRFSRSSDQSFWGTGTPSLFAGVSEQMPLLDGGNVASKAFALLFGSEKSGGFGWWWHTTDDLIEHIDINNLARDCRIYLAAVYQACLTPIIPYTQTEAIKEIHTAIINYANLAGSYIDFKPILTTCSDLYNLINRIEITKTNFNTKSEIYLYNQFMIKLERILVPLNYVSGSKFFHDSVSRQQPIPILAEINDLVTETDSHRQHCHLISIQRKLNKVQNELRQALFLSTEFHNKYNYLLNNK